MNVDASINELLCDTDEAVEKEIETLRNSPYVKLARKAERVRQRRKQYLYTLRMYEKKGKALAAKGLTLEALESLDEQTDTGSAQ